MKNYIVLALVLALGGLASSLVAGSILHIEGSLLSKTIFNLVNQLTGIAVYIIVNRIMEGR